MDMQDLKRPPCPSTPANRQPPAGAPIVLMGYATGLAAILARTDETTFSKSLQKAMEMFRRILDGWRAAI